MIIWGAIPKAHLGPIKVLINNTLPNILHVIRDYYRDPHYNVTDMYRSLNILQFYEIHKLLIFEFIYFILYDNFSIFYNHLNPFYLTISVVLEVCA